jgi:hypothetical protein
MPRNRSCGSYGPGHLMHWIQGKKSHEDGQPVIKVKVVAVHDDGRVEIQGDDLKLTLWYHDRDRLRSALCFGGHAAIHMRHWAKAVQAAAVSCMDLVLAVCPSVCQIWELWSAPTAP